ncbi:hypothetical protein ACWC2T_29840 [Streptomyces sp. NPDC001393]
MVRRRLVARRRGRLRPVGTTNISAGLGTALLGFLAVLLAATRPPTVRRALTVPDAIARLTLPQALRVIGVAILIVMALGKLLAAFARRTR